MSVNFVRNVLNRQLLNYKFNHIHQKRLRSIKAALVNEKYSSLVVDKIKEVKLNKNQIRVQVHYCSLNIHDINYFKNKKENYVPGFEFSGEVLEIGPEITPDIANVGDRVAVLSKNRGGFAEQCVVDSIDVWKLPPDVKLKNAAALIYAHSTASYAFSNLTNINKDSKILITTTSAGLGLAGIDVAANLYKTKPIGVCLSEEVGAVVRERGAFKTTTFQNKNLTKEFSNADVIYDAIGGEYLKLITGCIKPGGHILCAGPVSSTLPTPPMNSWLSVLNIEGLRDSNPKLYRSLINDTLEDADQGVIGSYVCAQFKLDDINMAIKYIEEGKGTGKVLIKVLED